MKKEYPKFKTGELKVIYSKLPKIERKIIDDFASYCAIGANPRKIGDMKRTIIQFRYITQTPLDKTTLKELRSYLALLNNSGRTAYTTNGTKTHLKRFFRWKFKDWSKRFDDLRDIKGSKGFNYERINEGVLLNRKDIENIMKAESNISKKTFFITLYESGCRPQELREIKWADIGFNIDDDISEINVFSKKTKNSRKTFVKNSTFWLEKLRENSNSEFVFPSREGGIKPITAVTCANWVKDMGKKANKPNLYPYVLRHSRATELYGEMPEKVAQKFLGHGKDMSELYTHLSSKKVKEKIKEIIYKTEEIPEEKKHELEIKNQELENRLNKIEEEAKQEQKIRDIFWNILTSDEKKGISIEETLRSFQKVKVKTAL